MFILVVIIVMVMVAFAFGIIALLAMVVVMVVMVLMLHALHLGPQAVFLHGLLDLGAVQLGPGRGDQTRVVVEPLEQFNRFQDLGIFGGVGTAHDDQVGIGHLVVEELAEVAHVHLCLARVHHGDLGADLRALDPLHSGGNVGELAHAGRLDDDAVGGKILHDLLQRLGEVAHQSAADAAGIHLGDLHTGVFQEAAVYGDLAELIFDQDQLLAFVTLGDQFADQRSLARAQKAGINVDLRHCVSSVYLQ